MPVHSQSQLRLPYINSQHAVISQTKHSEEDIETGLQDTFPVVTNKPQRPCRQTTGWQSSFVINSIPDAPKLYIRSSAASSGVTNCNTGKKISAMPKATMASK